MKDIYDYKYIDENSNEYIVAKTTKIDDKEYVMMTNLNDCDDYFMATFNKENGNDEFEIIEDEGLLRRIINSME